MSELFLSIIIPLIDRDCSVITELIDTINKNVKPTHEIIIIDNREKLKDEKIDFKDAKVYSKGRNLYQFESKRWGATFAKGEYIWFVDGDDSILEVDCDEDRYSKYDLIVFNCLHFTKEGIIQKMRIPSGVLQTKDYDVSVLLRKVVCTTWNKWFKTKKLKELIKKLPKDKEIIMADDTFWNAYFLSNIDQVYCVDKRYYQYNICTGITSSYLFSLDNFLLFGKGVNEMREIMNSVLNKKLTHHLIKESVSFLISLCQRLKKTEIPKALDYIKTLAPKDELYECLLYTEDFFPIADEEIYNYLILNI